MDVSLCIYSFNRYYWTSTLCRERSFDATHSSDWPSSQVQNGYPVGAISQGHSCFLGLRWLWRPSPRPLAPQPLFSSLSSFVQLASIGPGSLPCSRDMKKRAVPAPRGLVHTLLQSCPWVWEPAELVFLLTSLQSCSDSLQTLPSFHFSPPFPFPR